MVEVEEQQLVELVLNEVLQGKQEIDRVNTLKKLSPDVNDESQSVMKPPKSTAWKKLMSLRKEEKENNMNEEERTEEKKMETLKLWNMSSHNTENNDSEDIKGKSKKSGKSKKKFIKASKMAAFLSQLTEGQDICTCVSLDSECKVHDG